MHRHKSRMLAAALAVIMLLSSVVPGTAMAAEGQTSNEAETVSVETEPTETEGDGEISGEGFQGESSEESLEESTEESSEETIAEEDSEDDAAEADSNDTADSDDADDTDEEQASPSQTEESEQENDDENAAQDPEEIATGRFAIQLDSEGGVVKVIVSSDEDASESDPSYKLEKSGDSVVITERTGNNYNAVKTAEGYVLDIEEEAGASVTVIADSAEGYQVSRYTVSTDTGDEENVDFAESDPDFSYTASIEEGTRKVFSIAFDKMEDDMPAFEAEQKAGNVLVKVKAERGVLPKGTTFKAVDIFDKDHMDIIGKALDNTTGYFPAAAVDITFFDEDGNEIEPNGMVQVSFEDQTGIVTEAEDAVVVHVTDEGKTEEIPTDITNNEVIFENDEFSPYVLMSYDGGQSNAPAPPNDNGSFTGNEQTPSSVTFTSGQTTVYYKYRAGMNGYSDYYHLYDGNTRIVDVTDSNGNKGKAVCADPLADPLYQGTYSNVVKITSANLLKTLYYGIVDTTYIDSLANTTNRNKWVLVHFAASYYVKANGLIPNSHFNSMHPTAGRYQYQYFWENSSPRLKTDLALYMNYIESQPTPSGYTAYIVYPNRQTNPQTYQSYIYLVGDKTTTTEGSVNIEKRVVDSDGNRKWDDNTTFTFHVDKLQLNGNDLAPVTAQKVKGDGTPIGEAFTIKSGDTFELQQFEVLQILNLPMGTKYEISEVDLPEGYTLISVTSTSTNQNQIPTAKGTIIDENGQRHQYQVFTNKIKTTEGSISIEKRVVDSDGNRKWDDYTTFTFHVDKLQLNGNDLAPVTAQKVKGDGTPIGEAFTIKAGNTFELQQFEVLQILNLPMGTKYEISEVDLPEGYTLISVTSTSTNQNQVPTAKGTIIDEDGQRHQYQVFTNKIKTTEGSVSIEKKVVGPDGNRITTDDTVFTFKVDKLQLDGAALTDVDAVKEQYDLGQNLIDSQPIEIQENRTFELKQYEVVKISNLPMGTKYKISEVAEEGYELTKLEKLQDGNWAVQDGTWTAEGTIENQDGHRNPYYRFTNGTTTTEEGSVSIEKRVVNSDDEPINDDTEFEFKVNKLQLSGQKFNDATYQKFDAEGNALGNPAPVRQGYVFNLQQNELLVISNLPIGTEYEISEVNLPGGYWLSSVSLASNQQYIKRNAEGTILDEQGNMHSYYTFTNRTTETGSISITKNIVDKDGNEIEIQNTKDEFSFYVNWLHIDNEAIDAVPAQKYDREDKEIGDPFYIHATDSFTLKDDETIKITEVPTGTEFEIIEDEMPSVWYKLYSIEPAPSNPDNVIAEGTITTEHKEFSFEFDNSHPGGNVVINKELLDSDDDDTEFEFIVKRLHFKNEEVRTAVALKLEGTADQVGERYNISVGDTFKLTQNQRLQITELPIGTEFEFEEINIPEGYELTSISGPENTDGLVIKGIVTWERITKKFSFINSKTTIEPKVRTKAIDCASGTHTAYAGGQVTIEDTVTYENLTVGNEYVLKGSLVDKSTGNPIKDAEGNDVTAEKSFPAETANGTVKMKFIFNADSSFVGKSTVVFESLEYEGTEVAEHADINDEDQTIHFPKVGTSASNPETDERNLMAKENAKIVDTVSYWNLVPGEEYTVKGVLMVKATGEPLKVDGSEVTSETTFTPDKPDGTVEVTFTFDATGLEDSDVVVFEELYIAESLIGEHKDIDDEDQTIEFPDLHTNAINAASGTHNASAGDQVTIVDYVTYSNLIVGKDYVVKGHLVDKKTGEPIKDAEGNEVTAEKEFTAETPDGTVEMEFTFNTDSSFAGKTTVVFESLEYDEVEIAVHADINDDNQTIYFSNLGTSAINPETGDRILKADEIAKIVDTVSYENLVPGEEYTVKGVLMVKATGEPLLVDGNEVTSEKTFTPSEPNGTVEVTFTFDATGLENSDVVIFEELYLGENIVGEHKDIDDEDQTIHIPEIGTKATDAESGTNNALAGGPITIVDTVTYSNLIVGKEYVVKGHLVDKETGEPIKDTEGNEVTAEKSFTAETANGTVELEFTFDADIDLAGKTIVAFESLDYIEKEVAVHADINDEDQSIHFPKVGTSATNPETGDSGATMKENAKIVDTVSYENLLPGEEYTVKGVLMVKATGEPLLVDGNEVTAEKKFTPSEPNGTVEVTFTFDATDLEDSDVVVFEELYIGETIIGEHKDINDKDQTIHFSDIETEAYDEATGKKNTLAAEDRVIADEVHYSNLIAGNTYEISGEVKIKPEDDDISFDEAETVPSEIIGAEGEGVISFDADKVTFIPAGNTGDAVSGVLIVRFKVDATYLAGEEIVVGETVSYKGVDIAVHRDINDDKQSDYIPDGHTVSVDKDTDIKNTLAADNRVFKDTFMYEKLLPGETYRFTGKVMVETGTTEEGAIILEQIPSVMTDENGVPVENGYYEFTPETPDGTLDLYFSIDATELANKNVTVFEKVTLGGEPVIIHEVLDGTQTVYVPDGETTAIDSETQDQISLADEEVTIIDTMVYKNLIPGTEYTVKGRVMKKSTGEEIPSSLTDAKYKDAEDGEEQATGTISVSENVVTFVPEQKDGALELTFVIDASELKGEDTVVFERVYHNNVEVIIHENIDDESQTIHIPDGHTTASDPDTNDRSMMAEGEVLIKDRVYYENLLPGREYAITGKVMLKPTDDSEEEELEARMVDPDGNEINEWVFTPETSDGTEDVYFVVNAESLAGRSVVMFERIEYINPELFTRTTIVIHEDIDDEDETIHFPDGGTTALDSETGNHTAYADEEVTIFDEVKYKNLIPGKTYTVTGKLMDKDTGAAVVVDGEEIVSTKTFVPSSADGSVVISFTFDGSALAGKSVVAFETVQHKGKDVFVHADINDEDQTVNLPEVKTSASDQKDGDKEISHKGTVRVIDHVKYRNLTVGTKYRVSGVLMNKSTNKPAIADGKEIVAEAVFTAKEKDGIVTVEFVFNSSALKDGKYVVFESIYEINAETGDENIVGTHKDINDEAQTVVRRTPKDTSNTGDDNNTWIWLIALGLAIIGAAASVLIRRSRIVR